MGDGKTLSIIEMVFVVSIIMEINLTGLITSLGVKLLPGIGKANHTKTPPDDCTRETWLQDDAKIIFADQDFH